MTKPIEKQFATISALSHEGRGIAHIENKTTFIFGALPGEEVEFRYTRRHRQYDEGTVIRILKASPSRIRPRCAFFGVCGGCALQHLNIEDQLAHKESVLSERFQHISHILPRENLTPLHDEPWGYRHRARLSVHYSLQKQKVVVGFREQHSHRVADITHCEVLAPAFGPKIKALADMLNLLSVKDKIPQIEIAITDTVCALIIRHLAVLNEEDLKHIDAFAQTHQCCIYLQAKGPESLVFRASGSHLENKAAILEYSLPLHQVRIQFQPLQFTQINPRINVKMIDRAIELLAPTEDDHILDLFCGIGNFTLPLARYCKSITGVEGDPHSVSQARHNAKLNDIKNASFFTANLFEGNDGEPWARGPFNKVLLDPPRAGAKEILPLIHRLQPSHIVYVSCHSATLARDIHSLLELGYTLEKAGMMDMFPHTQHAEAIALLQKKHD